MIAGWRRRGVVSARQSRSRTVVVAVALAVLAVIIGEVAADVVGSGKKAARVEAETYVAQVLPLIDESTELASTMHLVRHGASSLDRTGLEQALGRLVSGTSGNLDELASLGVPAPRARSARLLRDTLAVRAAGARMLTGGMTLAIGPAAFSAGGGGSTLPASIAGARAKAVSLLTRAGEQLILADRDYRKFVLSLPRSSGRGRLPGSKWVSDPASWSSASMAAWVGQLSGSSLLQIHRDLVIVAVSVEPPVVRITGLPTTTTSSTTSTTTSTSVPGGTKSPGTTTSTTPTPTSVTETTTQLPPPGSVSVLSPTDHLAVVLVVGNAGNVELSAIWAAASVVGVPATGPHGHRTPPTRLEAVRIGRLAAGSSIEVTLPEMKVLAGHAYTLWASVGTGALPRGPVTTRPRGPGQIDRVDITVAGE